MSANDIGHNYAMAFIESLKTPEDIRKAGSDLHIFSALLEQLPALARVLQHPGTPLARRQEILDEALLPMDVHPVSRRLFHLIVEKDRVQSVKQIDTAFAELRDARLNVTSAEVVTAVPLDDRGRSEWEHALGRLTGKKVSVSYRTDDALLGGALAKVGSVVYDGSLRNELERMRGLLLKERG